MKAEMSSKQLLCCSVCKNEYVRCLYCKCDFRDKEELHCYVSLNGTHLCDRCDKSKREEE